MSEVNANDAATFDDELSDADVNRIDDEAFDDDGAADVAGDEAFDDDDEDANRIEGTTARAVVEYLVASLVNESEAVTIEADTRGRKISFKVHVAPDDMGRVIGRRGRVAQAIRTVVEAAGAKDGMETNVDIVDE